MIQMIISLNDDNSGDDRRQDVGHRHGIQHAVKTEKQREQQREAHAEDDLPHHREQGRFHRLAHRLQEDEGRLVYAGEDHHNISFNTFQFFIDFLYP